MMLTFELILNFLRTPLHLYITVGILGALMGSFLNVLIYRLPLMLEREWLTQCAEFLASLQQKRGQSHIHCEVATQNIDIQIAPRATPVALPTFNLMWPPSHCPTCKKHIRWWHNIPLLSYLFLAGSCHYCRTKIPLRYFSIELLTAITSVITAVSIGWEPSLVPALLFTWLLIAVTFIDIDEHMLPDDVTLFGLWVGLFFSLQHLFVSLSEAVIGAMAGYLVLWGVYWVFKLLTKKEGMGYGDFKLMACVGAWLGYKMLPVVILIASLTGSFYGLTRILFHHQDKNEPIPFGPFIAMGAWLTLVAGEPIVDAYLHWIH